MGDQLGRVEDLRKLLGASARAAAGARLTLARQAILEIASSSGGAMGVSWLRSVSLRWSFFLGREESRIIIFRRRKSEEETLLDMRLDCDLAPAAAMDQPLQTDLKCLIRWPHFLSLDAAPDTVVFNLDGRAGQVQLVGQVKKGSIDKDSLVLKEGTQVTRLADDVALRTETFIRWLLVIHEWLASPEEHSEWVPLPTPDSVKREPARRIVDAILASCNSVSQEAQPGKGQTGSNPWLTALPIGQRVSRFSGSVLLRLNSDGTDIADRDSKDDNPLTLELSYALAEIAAGPALRISVKPPDFLFVGELYETFREKIEEAALNKRIYEDLELSKEEFQHLMRRNDFPPIIIRVERRWPNYHRQLVLLRNGKVASETFLFEVWIQVKKEGKVESVAISAPSKAPGMRNPRPGNEVTMQVVWHQQMVTVAGSVAATRTKTATDRLLRLMLALSRWGGVWS